MSCYRKGQKVFDTGLRRVCKITGVIDEGTVHDHKLYNVRASKSGCQNEATCCELRDLNPKTEAGRHNRKIVEKVEKLLGQLL
jgi:hypothetical protein